MSEPTVRLLLFAAAREAAGIGRTELPVAPSGASVSELLSAIVERYPALAPHASSIRLAVNGEYARDDDRVRPGDEIAVLPPLAGG
jgi:molybdopterin converting factor subunit 1